jgi:natural product biosynthesis luciferase-like monooxygenase protein
VAEEWALVDNLSNGRIEISFAPGWNSEDFALRPGAYARRHDLMYEGIQTVERLWSGQMVEVRDGNNQCARVRTYPTPVQKHLIKWITAAGSARSFEHAGQVGAHLLTHLFDQSVDELANKITLYRRALAQHGWDPNAGRVAVALHTFVADDPGEVHRKAYPAYCEYLKGNLKLLEKLAQSRNSPFGLSQLPPAQLDEAVAWLYEKFLQQRSLLGTPESCAALIHKLADVGVQEVACLIDFGPKPRDILDSLPKLSRLKDLTHTQPSNGCSGDAIPTERR